MKSSSASTWAWSDRRRLRAALLRWPLPALWAWLCAWGLHSLLLTWGRPVPLALLAGTGVGMLGAALWAQGRLRRALVALGYPLSALVLGWAGNLPPWTWLLLLAPLLLAYPLRAWQDAPFFPTPAAALQGLAAWVPAPTRVLDAGCGMGHGLRALQGLWPQARLHGVEWSLPLAWLSARRCPTAQVKRGDMWAQPWHGFDLVYLFQRPESMARAWAKARAELPPGGWLVSLEFEVPAVQATACLRQPGQRPVWLYRLAAATDSAAPVSTPDGSCR